MRFFFASTYRLNGPKRSRHDLLLPPLADHLDPFPFTNPSSHRPTKMTPTPTLATAPPLNSHKRSSSPAARSTRPKRDRTWVQKVSAKQKANGEETDEHRVAQRQKQIDYGKNTLLYDAFVAAVPRDARLPRHPMTPLVTQKCSKRSFVGPSPAVAQDAVRV